MCREILKQRYTSSETSINVVNKIYKQGYFKIGDEILDYGGGKYDSNVDYLKEQGITCLVYDPFNRSDEHNNQVLDYFKNKHGAKNIVCSNVLCVIQEDEVILNILENIKNLINKENGSKIYIQIYEGDKSGIGKVTTKGYQRNQKSSEYTQYIDEIFDKISIIKRKGNIFEIKLI